MRGRAACSLPIGGGVPFFVGLLGFSLPLFLSFLTCSGSFSRCVPDWLPSLSVGGAGRWCWASLVPLSLVPLSLSFFLYPCGVVGLWASLLDSAAPGAAEPIGRLWTMGSTPNRCETGAKQAEKGQKLRILWGALVFPRDFRTLERGKT